MFISLQLCSAFNSLRCSLVCILKFNKSTIDPFCHTHHVMNITVAAIIEWGWTRTPVLE